MQHRPCRRRKMHLHPKRRCQLCLRNTRHDPWVSCIYRKRRTRKLTKKDTASVTAQRKSSDADTSRLLRWRLLLKNGRFRLMIPIVLLLATVAMFNWVALPLLINDLSVRSCSIYTKEAPQLTVSAGIIDCLWRLFYCLQCNVATWRMPALSLQQL